jgi:hypothetical protein
MFHEKFVQRWTERCIELNKKYGKQAADAFAKDFLGSDIIRLVNIEIEKRKKK